MCWGCCERNENTMQKSQDICCTQHKWGNHRWHFVAQLDPSFRECCSWTKWELAKTERLEKWEELVEDGDSQWRNLEMRSLYHFAWCIIQGILVGHRVRTRAISCIIKSGIVRGNMSDKADLEWRLGIDDQERFCLATLGIVGCMQRSWEQNWRRSSLQTKNGTNPPVAKNVGQETSGGWAKKILRFCLRISKLTDTWEVVRDVRCLLRMEKRQNHVRMNSESESVTVIEKTLAEEARMETCEDRIAETERVTREEKSSKLSEVQGMCLMEPRDKDDEQVAVRHADASGGYIIENQHEEEKIEQTSKSVKKRIRGSNRRTIG